MRRLHSLRLLLLVISLVLLHSVSATSAISKSKQCLVDILVEHETDGHRVTKQLNHLTIHQLAESGYPSQISLHLTRYDGQAGGVTLNLVKTSIGRGLANTTGHKFDCHYSGHVLGNAATHASVNLCTYGVSGVVISPSSSTFALTEIAGTFRLSDALDLDDDAVVDCSAIMAAVATRSRSKRAVGDFPPYYEPYVDKTRRRYVELVIVQDSSVFKKYNNDFERVLARTLDIANLVNALYSPLNIQVTLVHYEIWQSRDEIAISANSDRTLDAFLAYRQQRILPDHPHDNAHLITDTTFEAGVIGKAHKGTMCSYRQSGGIDLDHSHHALAVASTVSHEMAHNFGAEHDTAKCECATDRCLMAPMTGGLAPTVWSSCSVEYISHALSHGMDDCLLNEPRSIADAPVCGNGILEEGEECDCGVPEACDAMRCCIPSTCRLKGEAKCGSGPCCDTQSCEFKSVGTVCRTKRDSACDLSEHCSGESAHCPTDTHVHDGIECADGEGYCSSGKCGSHTGQCQRLWGESGTKSPDICYSYNTRAQSQLSLIGNCGYNRDTRTYKSCSQTDALCGRLLCQHENEKTIYGSATVVRTSHAYLSLGAKRYAHCRAAMFDFGESAEDTEPGMVPDGASCGVGRMCRDVKCVRTSTILDVVPCASADCSGNGKCNDRGECHCDDGYGGWDCSSGGAGGSPSSGPASTSGWGMWTFLLILVLIAVPCSMVVIVCRRHRRGHKGAGDNLFASIVRSLRAYKPKPRRPPPPPKTSVPRSQPPLPTFTPPQQSATTTATLTTPNVQWGATWSPAADRKPLTPAVSFKANDYATQHAGAGVYNATTTAPSSSSSMTRSGTLTKSDISAPVDYAGVAVPHRHAPPLPSATLATRSTGHMLDATGSADPPPVVVKERAATVNSPQPQSTSTTRPEAAPPSRPDRPRESALVQLYSEQKPFQRATIERKSSSASRPSHLPPKPPRVAEDEDYYEIGTLPRGKPAPPPKATKPTKPIAAVKPVKVASVGKIADMAAKFEK